MQKIPSHESGPSDYLHNGLYVDGKDWQVKYLEINDTELHLKLFKSVKDTKFGGESWKCIPDGQTFSVSMNIGKDSLCEKHAEECPMVFKVGNNCIRD